MLPKSSSINGCTRDDKTTAALPISPASPELPLWCEDSLFRVLTCTGKGAMAGILASPFAPAAERPSTTARSMQQSALIGAAAGLTLGCATEMIRGLHWVAEQPLAMGASITQRAVQCSAATLQHLSPKFLGKHIAALIYSSSALVRFDVVHLVQCYGFALYQTVQSAVVSWSVASVNGLFNAYFWPSNHDANDESHAMIAKSKNTHFIENVLWDLHSIGVSIAVTRLMHRDHSDQTWTQFIRGIAFASFASHTGRSSGWVTFVGVNSVALWGAYMVANCFGKGPIKSK